MLPRRRTHLGLTSGAVRLIVAGCAVTTIAACSRRHPADPTHDVDIAASDGSTLKASYYSPGRPGPGILLFHQCTMDRHAWDGLVGDLTGAGFHVLTFDQRGYGESDRRGWSSPQTIAADGDTVYAFVRGKSGVDPDRIAVGGASCGVARSIELASRHREIKALLLMSGDLPSGGRGYLAAPSSAPVFGAASTRDDGAAGIRDALSASKHPSSALRMYDGTAHGVEMFDTHPELKGAIVEWLQRELGREPARP